jgi:hypothetical protein
VEGGGCMLTGDIKAIVQNDNIFVKAFNANTIVRLSTGAKLYLMSNGKLVFKQNTRQDLSWSYLGSVVFDGKLYYAANYENGRYLAADDPCVSLGGVANYNRCLTRELVAA